MYSYAYHIGGDIMVLNSGKDSVSVNQINSDSLANVFKYMFEGVGITTAVSSLLYYTGAVAFFPNNRIFSIMLFAVQIILTIAMGNALTKNTSVEAMKTMFFTYSCTMGVNMTSIAAAYNVGQIAAAFAISAIYFACLAVIGKSTKIDLTKIGHLCLACLGVLVVSQLLFLIFKVPINVRILSIFGILIFTGITAWDIQRMHRQMSFFSDEKYAIYFALQLYLDFINIFIYILQLVVKQSSDS